MSYPQGEGGEGVVDKRSLLANSRVTCANAEEGEFWSVSGDCLTRAGVMVDRTNFT
ncbi:hypothetical protein CAQUA_01960 [Corynebacterium aquatimens]|nr:hypothetical protein CAQUA_01960 [Corynebacterium aquatimens]